MFKTVKISDSYRERSQDRLAVIEHASGVVIALADGAGGMSGGTEAAEAVIMWTKALVSRAGKLHVPDTWCELLRQIDFQVHASDAGQTTAVIVAVSNQGMVGASQGDSAAWLIRGEKCTDLTENQARKPLLGSGHARPVGFQAESLDGTLLVASDGLVKYAPRQRICSVALEANMDTTARKLVDLSRLRSGALQDDVSLVLCRPVQ